MPPKRWVDNAVHALAILDTAGSSGILEPRPGQKAGDAFARQLPDIARGMEIAASKAMRRPVDFIYVTSPSENSFVQAVSPRLGWPSTANAVTFAVAEASVNSSSVFGRDGRLPLDAVTFVLDPSGCPAMMVLVFPGPPQDSSGLDFTVLYSQPGEPVQGRIFRPEFDRVRLLRSRLGVGGGSEGPLAWATGRPDISGFAASVAEHLDELSHFICSLTKS